MRICFVLPHCRERPTELQYIYLGIAYLGSSLVSNGHTVRVIDSRIDQLPLNQILGKITSFRPKIVGFSSSTCYLPSNLGLLKEIKKNFPDMITVLGGSHVSALPKETLQMNPCIDIGVIGEGEQTFPELVDTIEKGKSLYNVKGIIFRKSNQLVLTKKRDNIENLDALPMPARDLFDTGKYNSIATLYKKKPMTSIMTSRGCPYNCRFCSRTISGTRFRARSVKNVVDEIEILEKDRNRYKEIHIMDDNFSMDMLRSEKIFEEIYKRDINMQFAFINGLRVDKVNKRLLSKIYKGGGYYISFGVESLDQGVLSNARKNINTKQISNAIKTARDIGFYVNVFLMSGLPGSTYLSDKRTVNMIAAMDPDEVTISSITVLPGSMLYSELKKQAHEPVDWSTYRRDHLRWKQKDNLSDDFRRINCLRRDLIRNLYLKPVYPFRMICNHRSFGLRRMYNKSIDFLRLIKRDGSSII